jgi:hypothetical protein
MDAREVVMEALKQRLADVERFLAVEEAADRGADVAKIARLRDHRIALQLIIDEHAAAKIAEGQAA